MRKHNRTDCFCKGRRSNGKGKRSHIVGLKLKWKHFHSLSWLWISKNRGTRILSHTALCSTCRFNHLWKQFSSYASRASRYVCVTWCSVLNLCSFHISKERTWELVVQEALTEQENLNPWTEHQWGYDHVPFGMSRKWDTKRPFKNHVFDMGRGSWFTVKEKQQNRKMWS